MSVPLGSGSYNCYHSNNCISPAVKLFLRVQNFVLDCYLTIQFNMNYQTEIEIRNNITHQDQLNFTALKVRKFQFTRHASISKLQSSKDN